MQDPRDKKAKTMITKLIDQQYCEGLSRNSASTSIANIANLYYIKNMDMNIASVPLLVVYFSHQRDVIRDRRDRRTALSPTVRRYNIFEHGIEKKKKIEAVST